MNPFQPQMQALCALLILRAEFEDTSWRIREVFLEAHLSLHNGDCELWSYSGPPWPGPCR